MDTISCLTTIFATLLMLSSVNEAILAQAKSSNGTTVSSDAPIWNLADIPIERSQILIFCTVIARSLPFLPLLLHYVFLFRPR